MFPRMLQLLQQLQHVRDDFYSSTLNLLVVKMLFVYVVIVTLILNILINMNVNMKYSHYTNLSMFQNKIEL